MESRTKTKKGTEPVAREPEKPATKAGTRLMLEAQAGDRDAYGELFAIYQQPVNDFLVSRDCIHTPDELEDLVHEVFLRAWHRRQVFRGDSSAKTFLFGIAVNVLREEYRAARRQLHISLEDLSTAPQAADTLGTIDKRNDVRQLAAIIQPAIDHLAPRQREAFRLVVLDGRSFAEAARLTDCTPKTIRDRLTASLAHLRTALALCSANKCPPKGPAPPACPAERRGINCLKSEILKTF
jgi:RNA polymerase sigma factor (sigma-70 family)